MKSISSSETAATHELHLDPARDTETLFRQWKETGDSQVREQLIMLHLNLVRYLARKFAGRGEPLEDLTQVGMVGLIHAVDRFDPTRGIRFATFATPTIVGEIKRHFRDRGWAMKIPRRLQELNHAATKAMDQLTQTLQRAPTAKEVAEAIGASEEEALEALELGSLYSLSSLEGELSFEDDDSHAVLADYVGRQDPTFEDMGMKARIQDALSQLETREREIILARFFHDMPQTEVAKRLGISQMHVSRLQQRALTKLRGILRESD